jgi:hypothetical protein
MVNEEMKETITMIFGYEYESFMAGYEMAFREAGSILKTSFDLSKDDMDFSHYLG